MATRAQGGGADFSATYTEWGTLVADDQNISASFSKLRGVLITGNAANFDDATDEYVVPSNGLYLAVGYIRVADNSPSGRSYGMGLHTSASDGPWFLWHLVNNGGDATRRSTFPYTRMVRLTANQRVQMFSFANDTLTVTGRQMAMLKVAP